MKTFFKNPSCNTVVKTVVTVAAIQFAVSADASTDYSPAIYRPMSGCSKWYTTGNGHKFAVCHDMEGYYASTISYLNQCSVSTSIHYMVNGKQDASSDYPAGEVDQQVREANYAWHARCWNTWMFGTEHEGFASNPAWYTEAMYQASADLQRHLCEKSNFAKDRNHVIGHNEGGNAAWRSWVAAHYPSLDATCNTHQDPGAYWDWNHLMDLIGDKPGVVRGITWKLRKSMSTGSSEINFDYGLATDQFVMGDWDGNATATPGAFRDGVWYMRNANSDGSSDYSFQFGTTNDLPIAGDWDGDGQWSVGVFRSSNATFYMRNAKSTGASDYSFQYGQAGDLPVAGDWDGDGQWSEGVFRPSNGTFYLRNAKSTGASDYIFQFGQAGDIPVAGDWDGDGQWSVGVFRPSNGTFYLRNAKSTGPSDYSFQYGTSGDKPLIWR